MPNTLHVNNIRLKSFSVLPGFTLSLGISLLFISLIILLPLSGLVIHMSDLSWLQYWQIISEPRVVASYKVTILAAFAASIFNGMMGLLLAWVLTRYDFRGRLLIDSLVDLPFALPTAVAGITLATLYAENGWLGAFFAEFGIKISYTPVGIFIAMTFTSIPFVVRTVQPVLEELSHEHEEAALTLGASDWTVFRRVIFPTVMPALVTGVGLSFTRSLGEFGAVIFIAGNMPYVSEITSLMIMIKLEEYDFSAASAIASVVLILSLVLLFLINLWQAKNLNKIQEYHG